MLGGKNPTNAQINYPGDRFTHFATGGRTPMKLSATGLALLGAALAVSPAQACHRHYYPPPCGAPAAYEAACGVMAMTERVVTAYRPEYKERNVQVTVYRTVPREI